MKTHVIKTAADAPLAEALDLMDVYQVDGLPVVDADQKLCGMLTEQDVWRAVVPPDSDPGGEPLCVGNPLPSWLHPEKAQSRVAEWMTRPAVAIEETADVRDAAMLLMRHGWKRLPVVTREGQVVGTLNRIDVLQALFEGNL